MGFLDDLKNKAQALESQLRDEGAEAARRTTEVEAACAQTWRYLEELARQLQVLQPPCTTRFVIDPRAVVSGMRYSNFTADVRRKRIDMGPLAAPEVVDHMVLTARLVSGQSFRLTKDFPPEIERLEARLAQGGIRCIGEPVRDVATGRFLQNRYDFVADLVVGVRVLPLHGQGRLQFVIQNFDGLLTIKATFAAEQITPARLDELAKWWVGEPQRFLDGAVEVLRIEPR